MDARLVEKLQVLAGDRGKPQDHALRKGEVANIQSLIAQLRTATSNIGNSIAAIQKNADGVTEELEGLSEDLNNTEQELSLIQERVTNIDSSLGSIEDRIETAESALSEILNVDLGNLSDRIGTIEDSLNTIKSQVSAVTISAITSSQAGGAPTQSEYNALQQDVVNLHLSLTEMKAAITT